MLCEMCAKANATVHLTEITDTQKKELHVCDDCARKQGLVQKVSITINELVNKMVAPKIAKQHEALRCPACGLTYAEFRARGRFGCARDYEIFSPGLPPLFEKIHGASRHVGSSPGDDSPAVALEGELARLKKQLGEMKKAENFEKCAELRDRIVEVEEKLRRP